MFLIVMILLFATALADSGEKISYSFTVSKEEDNMFKKCFDASGLTEEELAAAVRAKDANAGVKVKHLYGCVLKESGVINDNLTLNVDALIKFHHVENVEPVKKVLIECAKVAKGDNYFDLAYSVESCLHSSNV